MINERVQGCIADTLTRYTSNSLEISSMNLVMARCIPEATDKMETMLFDSVHKRTDREERFKGFLSRIEISFEKHGKLNPR